MRKGALRFSLLEIDLESSERASHWDAYYQGRGIPHLPSQFAVFALAEVAPSAVVDVGCGSGRDAFFFASQGLTTLGLDGSRSAVELCASKVAGPNVEFMQLNIMDASFSDRVSQQVGPTARLLIYARFFIHAITDEEEAFFLSHVSNILRVYDGVLGVEFRTPRDRALNKVTPDHYRRFVDPGALIVRAAGHGLECSYATEGFGMAKFGQDDAYVARLLFKRTTK